MLLRHTREREGETITHEEEETGDNITTNWKQKEMMMMRMGRGIERDCGKI